MAAATVRGLILTVSHKEQIGELYPQVLRMLVRGACEELYAEASNAGACEELYAEASNAGACAELYAGTPNAEASNTGT